MAKILTTAPDDLSVAGIALNQGDIVGVPTETVYGLAGLISHPAAIAKIFSVKERPSFDPLIVHVGFTMKEISALEAAGIITLENFDEEARLKVRKLIDLFWPGPLTLVLPRGKNVPDIATSGLSTVAVRMPRHSVTLALLALAGPFAAPSANRFGRISPTTAEAVAQELGDRIQWIVDGGPCEVGVESTIISISERGDVTLLREGGTPSEKIADITGAIHRVSPANANQSSPAAPGMLENHYAPQKPLHILSKCFRDLDAEDFKKIHSYGNVGLILLSGDEMRASIHLQQEASVVAYVRSLSASGNLEEVAQHLFAGLREMDAAPVNVILIEPCNETRGLGPAIADRLKRAAAPRLPDAKS